MRRLILLLILILAFVPVVTADDFFDSYAGIEHAWDGQKSITNQEFEKAIETLQEGQKKKEAKQKKKKIKKVSGGGTSLHSGLEPTNEINFQEELKKEDDNGQLLNIPVETVIEGKILEPGFYNIFGEKDKDNNIYISLYQSQYFKGKVKAFETDDDFGAETINFVKWLPYNDNYIRIIFGSLDFNAYAYLPCLQN